MELTKQDLREIDKLTDKAAFRISVEASEYARLYERTYLLRLAEHLTNRADAIESIDIHFKNQ